MNDSSPNERAPANPALLDAEELLQAFCRQVAHAALEALQSVTERTIARQNPEINAFVVMNPEALGSAARESTARWPGRQPEPARWTACR